MLLTKDKMRKQISIVTDVETKLHTCSLGKAWFSYTSNRDG